MASILLGAASTLALLVPLSPTATQNAVAPTAPAPAGRSSRRELLAGGALGLAAAVLQPLPAHASYALYQSSYDSFQDRKTTGFVPVATNDRESLAEIQAGIRRKRPQSSQKPTKAPQYCAGQTSAVSPMLENICANIGVSKADQSNTVTDAFGNMNIGTYTSLDQSERAAADARMQRVQQASEAARLRKQYGESKR